MRQIVIRKAIQSDLDDIKRLAEEERLSIGFLTRATYSNAINNGCILVIILDEKLVGFQNYYHRKRDRQTTLYQKTIDKQYRNQGLGRLLLKAVIEEAKSIGHNKLFLKCPIGLSSNEFHRKCGFKLIGQEPGVNRWLNLWEYNF
jgi:N-acetylglutamate synthase-like GNAT family acetyltransferase